MAKGCFQNLHITGIQRQRQVRHAAYLFQCPQHTGFFINTAHTHIDVQYLCTAGFLLLGELDYFLETAFLKLCLQCLLPGRIDALSHNKKTILQSKAVGNTFGGQIPDALRSSDCCNLCLRTKTVMDLSDKFRGGTATAA